MHSHVFDAFLSHLGIFRKSLKALLFMTLFELDLSRMTFWKAFFVRRGIIAIMIFPSPEEKKDASVKKNRPGEREENAE